MIDLPPVGSEVIHVERPGIFKVTGHSGQSAILKHVAVPPGYTEIHHSLGVHAERIAGLATIADHVHLMSPKGIEHCVALIAGEAEADRYWEAASQEEYLFRCFVEHVAAHGGELGEKAKLVLKSKEINFQRLPDDPQFMRL